MSSRTALLIDCDTGIDDALALLYAFGSDDAEVAGISCVAGNVRLDDIVRNTLAVAELAGRTDVDVAPGRDRPLVRKLRIADDTHGPTGLGYAELPAPTALPLREEAADAIVRQARARPGELTLVTTGPLTNVAVALEREPGLPRLLAGLVMMVGSYRSPGNTAPTLEWNAIVDPEALAAVIAGWEAAGKDVPRPRAMGLDVTERARMMPAHIERLAARVGNDDARGIVPFMSDALRFYFEYHRRYDGFYGAFIHDALAVAVALDPALARTEPHRVEIELEGHWTSGETVTDWRHAWDLPANVEVAIDADIETFFDRFIERVASLAVR